MTCTAPSAHRGAGRRWDQRVGRNGVRHNDLIALGWELADPGFLPRLSPVSGVSPFPRLGAVWLPGLAWLWGWPRGWVQHLTSGALAAITGEASSTSHVVVGSLISVRKT